MIISKTPFRISFFGGGTDYPVWYRENGGQVLSSTIDKYCYISVRHFPPFFPYKHRIVYSKIETVNTVDEILHPAVKAALGFFHVTEGLSIHHDGDLPARTGLGSSSAFTVGLLHALYALEGKRPSKDTLAKEAIHLERDVLKENVGSQDQVAVAYGGLNKIVFTSDEKAEVIPITIGEERVRELERHVMLLFSGFSRDATVIAKDQIDNTPQKKSELTRMYQMVDEAIGILLQDKRDILDFGKLLHESWQIKKSLSSKVSTPQIDDIYERALNAGAVGGKVLGAGGGGFILLFIPPEKRERVSAEFKDLIQVNVRLEQGGSKIIYSNNDI